MKSLKPVQTIFRVCKILCQIGLVCTFIGMVCTAVGALVLICVPVADQFPGMTQLLISDLFHSPVMLGVFLIGQTIMLIGGAMVLLRALQYLEEELKAGTPFTHVGADRLRRLGIFSLVVPLVTLIVAEMIMAITLPGTEMKMEIQVGAGIWMILLSFLFHYGADLEENRQASEENTPQ